MIAKGEAGIRPRRVREHRIRAGEDFDRHARCYRGNLVKQRLEARPAAGPYSSIHSDIRLGRVDLEWTATDPCGDFGE